MSQPVPDTLAQYTQQCKCDSVRITNCFTIDVGVISIMIFFNAHHIARMQNWKWRNRSCSIPFTQYSQMIYVTDKKIYSHKFNNNAFTSGVCLKLLQYGAFVVVYSINFNLLHSSVLFRLFSDWLQNEYLWKSKRKQKTILINIDGVKVKWKQSYFNI